MVFTSFLPELVLLAGALGLFIACLGDTRIRLAKAIAFITAALAIAACAIHMGPSATLFNNAYRVDMFSQILKLVILSGFLLILMISSRLPDIREDVRPEYFLFLVLHVTGLIFLVSSVELITLVVSLELSSFPLYLMVPMRTEGEGRRSQMESAIKYIMFGIAATGIMFFGMGYLFGLSGTTSIDTMAMKLQATGVTPLLIAGFIMMFCGLYYKLAVFPFHFWSPDVYQGASNETTSLIASLSKIGAVAVMVRLIPLALPRNASIIPMIFAILATASMFYGNLIALVQKDIKRLLGFSAIAHAGYAMVGLVAFNTTGCSAALYYIMGYMFMILACFAVVCLVSKDGANVSMEELAGLWHRSPLLAITLIVGAFALAGLPPFAGFMGKFAMLKAAMAKGYLWLVIIAVINAAIAIYYYLCMVREACFADVKPQHEPIRLNIMTRTLCVLLIVGNVGFGVFPEPILRGIYQGVATLLLGS